MSATKHVGAKKQMIDGHEVVIRKVMDVRYAVNAKNNKLLCQVEILPMCAGADAWMKKIKVPCSECGEDHEAGSMEGGGKDLVCGACFEKIGNEIEAQEKEEQEKQGGLGEVQRNFILNDPCRFTKAPPVVTYVTETSDLGWKPGQRLLWFIVKHQEEEKHEITVMLQEENENELVYVDESKTLCIRVAKD